MDTFPFFFKKKAKKKKRKKKQKQRQNQQQCKLNMENNECFRRWWKSKCVFRIGTWLESSTLKHWICCDGTYVFFYPRATITMALGARE